MRMLLEVTGQARRVLCRDAQSRPELLTDSVSSCAFRGRAICWSDGAALHSRSDCHMKGGFGTPRKQGSSVPILRVKGKTSRAEVGYCSVGTLV